jgi:hypothetical protein
MIPTGAIRRTMSESIRVAASVSSVVEPLCGFQPTTLNEVAAGCGQPQRARYERPHSSLGATLRGRPFRQSGLDFFRGPEIRSEAAGAFGTGKLLPFHRCWLDRRRAVSNGFHDSRSARHPHSASGRFVSPPPPRSLVSEPS